MATPILATKLFLPPPRPGGVPRPRLLARLDDGLSRKLTLVSAPAGFGKTTLVAAWAAAGDRPVAWLSLDSADSNPSRFLAYTIAALQTVDDQLGAAVLSALQAPQPPSVTALLTVLLNELSALPRPLLLVLDDYHAVDDRGVDEALTFLLDHLPPRLHLVILSREDPNLPLARLRARAQLNELRAGDLRFTHAEAADFLNRVMGLALSAETIATLEARTEGWAAGLQLAALSLHGRPDPARVVDTFAGDHRYIVDYLFEEVLQRLPPALRRFLLHSAVLDQLSGPLCDAVTGEPGSAAVLEELERANLFLIPLDDRRRWYRYHHLFRDVLRAHLQAEQPDQVATLHQRASDWYARHDEPAAAIDHALAAADFARAAALVERHWQAFHRSFRSATLLRWCRALPPATVRARPQLSVALAWALLSTGAPDAGVAPLQDAERLLADPDRPATAADRALPAMIASARAYRAQAAGDRAAALAYTQQAYDRVPPDDLFERGVAATLLGLAQWTNGDVVAADRTFSDGLRAMEEAGSDLAAVSGTFVHAAIKLARGRLRAAIECYRAALALADAPGRAPLRGAADLHLGLSELLREQGADADADQHLARSTALPASAALPPMQYRSRPLLLARRRFSAGAFEAALALLDEAERLAVPGPVPDVQPPAVLKARIWIAQGRLETAQAWAVQQGLSAESTPPYEQEAAHLALARLLVARYRRDGDEPQLTDALGLLQRMADSAESQHRTGSLLAIHVLQALAHEAHGNLTAALHPLRRALALAEAEQYVRLFADEGAPMARLLAAAAARGIHPAYCATLRAALGDPPLDTPAPPRPVAPDVEPLVEPLSERELEILALIAEGLSNRAIGDRLYLALSTIKGHNRNLFGKLQARNRTEAVARARALGLL